MVVVTAGSMSRLDIMHGLGSCRGMISFKTKVAQPNAFAKAHNQTKVPIYTAFVPVLLSVYQIH